MTNFKLTVLAAASFLIFFMTVFSAEAAAQNAHRQRYSAQQRAQIRATPILERPSRPLHFYGNTVRRNAGSNATQATKPASQVAASSTPASVDVSKAASLKPAKSVAADSVMKTKSESQALLAAAGKVNFKSILVSHPKSVRSIRANAELDGPITIHLTDLDAE